ncbi:hypothetical protein [Moritella marina]|uniref:hypothetical protein n=1 Tax=Moritella marina TaxID=90736 RepID=UPI003704162B
MAPEGKDLAASHPEHLRYLTYYNKIGIDPKFLLVHPSMQQSANDIHWMSAADMAKYDIATRDMTANDRLTCLLCQVSLAKLQPIYLIAILGLQYLMVKRFIFSLNQKYL